MAAADGDRKSAQATAPLDLRAPDITRLYTPQQIARFLARTFGDQIEGIEVMGERLRAPTTTPTVWRGLGAPFWALAHPTQAWRIFAPLPPDQTRLLSYEPPRATDTLLQPAAFPHETETFMQPAAFPYR